MTINNEVLLFNFSASHSGGGLKRLTEYSRWFNSHCGANFIVNSNVHGIEKQFSNNNYFFWGSNRLDRLTNSTPKIKDIIKKIGQPHLYYSYGIPVTYRHGKINWFHLSNVLPIIKKKFPLPLRRKCELKLLGAITNYYVSNADIISAESKSSLNLFDERFNSKKKLSVNGSDDEINAYNNPHFNEDLKNTAICVGTYAYKAVEDSYEIYRSLLRENSSLKLIIVGNKNNLKPYICNDPQVEVTGVIPQSQVCEYLKNSKYYLSSTLIENSYNAASEGVFLANESYISDIPPHRELLSGLKFDVNNSFNTKLPVLHLKKENLHPINLKTWDQVVTEMLGHVQL